MTPNARLCLEIHYQDTDEGFAVNTALAGVNSLLASPASSLSSMDIPNMPLFLGPLAYSNAVRITEGQLSMLPQS